jgi:anti-sigma B factor antagonist
MVRSMGGDAFDGAAQVSPWRRFGCTVAHTTDVVTVRLRGEFDLDAVELFGRSVAAAMTNRTERVIVDLRDLTFIDSSGLTAIISLSAQMRAATLTVVRGPGAVHRVFEYTGLTSKLTFVDSPDTGVEPAADSP